MRNDVFQQPSPEPELKPEDARILAYFNSLSQGRQWSNGMPLAFTWSDIAAWLQISGRKMNFDWLETIKAMDTAWRSAVMQEHNDIMERENG
jgi:hypothetical protein